MTHTSTEQPELLPCPFCGGDAGDTYYQLGWFISCKHCSASTEVTNAKARAVEAWNRRAPASQEQRVPLTDAQIHDWWRSENNLEDCDMCRFADFAQVVRAFELKYGITQEKQG